MGQILSPLPSTLYSHSSPCMWKYVTSPLSLVTQKSQNYNKFRYYYVMWYKFATHQMTNHSQQPNGLTRKSFSPHIKPAAWSYGSSVMQLVRLKLGTSYGIKDLNVFCLDGINCLNWTTTCMNQSCPTVFHSKNDFQDVFKCVRLGFSSTIDGFNNSFLQSFQRLSGFSPISEELNKSFIKQIVSNAAMPMNKFQRGSAKASHPAFWFWIVFPSKTPMD